MTRASDAATLRAKAAPAWPILDAVACLDALLAQAVARLHANQGADPFRGLHIAPEDVGRWLADGVDAPTIGSGLTSLAARTVESALDDPAMRWLAETLSLSPFHVAVLVLAFAPEFDLRYERLYAYLQDDVARRRPTVDLLLRLLCPDRVGRAMRLAEFAADAPLRGNRLLSVAAEPEQTLLAAPVQLDPQITELLLRQPHLDPRLAPFCNVTTPEQALDALPVAKAWRRALPPLLADARQRGAALRFYFEGPVGVGKADLAAAIAHALDARLISADARRLCGQPGADASLRLLFREAWLKGGVVHLTHADSLRSEDPMAISTLLRLAAADGGVTIVSGEAPFREAWLKGGVVHLTHADSLRSEDPMAISTLLRLAAADGGVTIVSGEAPWTEVGPGGLGVIRLVFDLGAPGVQMASWRAAIAAADVDLPPAAVATLAERFRLTPAQAAEAVAVAASQVRWRQALASEDAPEVVDLAGLFAAARLQCGHELAALARRIEPRRSWDDIVLPEESLAQMREICGRIANHGRVLGAWGSAERLSLGKGVTALFAGPSGTGKTLAAEIIASALGLFLYKVDLSSVVSKYIGETEKNLDRIFSAAQDANCVLFFDEADALFGKRSEVRDSHDRYANLEISYLLQKMEEFEGLAILATNLRQNLDEAFTRRLAFTVHFPFPDEAERGRIWRGIWPAATPLAADVDSGLLAHALKLSGGNIKNVALAAAYYAAADGGVVTRAHLLRAARREFQKMGKVPSALESAAVAGVA